MPGYSDYGSIAEHVLMTERAGCDPEKDLRGCQCLDDFCACVRMIDMTAKSVRSTYAKLIVLSGSSRMA